MKSRISLGLMAVASVIALSAQNKAPVPAAGRSPQTSAPIVAMTLFGQTSTSAGSEKPACSGQLTSLAAVKQVFSRGTLPSESQVTGSWVAIGTFGSAYSHGKEVAVIDCSGLKRGPVTFEEVILVEGYVIKPYLFGTPETGRERIATVTGNSISFPISFGGDASPAYECRMTSRGSLICLNRVYDEGREFVRMPVTEVQLCQPKPNDGYCLLSK